MSAPTPPSTMFSEPPRERAFPWLPVSIAAGAVLLAVVAIVLLGHRGKPAGSGVQPVAAYANSLPVSDLHMSESSSVGGVKQTYIDGTISNTGSQTVTGILTQTLFANDEKLAPQVETGPLMLIRAREPYIDTEPVSAEPLAPGAKRDFRLTFDAINANWNQTLPDIHIIEVAAR